MRDGYSRSRIDMLLLVQQDLLDPLAPGIREGGRERERERERGLS